MSILNNLLKSNLSINENSALVQWFDRNGSTAYGKLKDIHNLRRISKNINSVKKKRRRPELEYDYYY